MQSISRRNALCGTAAAAVAALPIAGAFAAAGDGADAGIIEKAREVLRLNEAWRVVNRPYDEADIALFQMREAWKGKKVPPEVKAQMKAQERKVAELKKPVSVAWLAADRALAELLAMPAASPRGMMAKLEVSIGHDGVMECLRGDPGPGDTGITIIVRDLYRLAGGRVV